MGEPGMETGMETQTGHTNVEPLTYNTMRQLLDEYLTPIRSDITDFKTSLNVMTGEIDEMKLKVDEIDFLKTQITNQEEMLSACKTENKKLRENILSVESQSRRDNLQFLGIEETQNENPENLVVDILQRAGLDINSRSIVRAHRLGAHVPNRQRPIIVKFHHFKDREAVMLIKEDISTQSNIRIVEDWPKEIQIRRRKLLPIFFAARNFRDPEYPEFRFKAKLIVDRLIINGNVYTVDTTDKLPAVLKLENLFTKKSDKMVVFYTGHSPLSNFYPGMFKVDGTQYTSVEQFVTCSKAKLFKDSESAKQIMRSDNPAQQKALGKKISSFNAETWNSNASEILHAGLSAKFGQDLFCAKFLQQTGKRIIGEANPHDKWNGVGRDLRDELIWDQKQWTGKNKLGQMLEKVRKELFGI